jgi:hypothetical protein
MTALSVLLGAAPSRWTDARRRLAWTGRYVAEPDRALCVERGRERFMNDAPDRERVAQCGCGRLKVRVRGEPSVVAACHCDFCRKQSGSAFRVSSFFGEDQILEITGDSNVYNGLEIDGVGLDGNDEYGTAYHFCGTCGSTVYWVTNLIPGFLASQWGASSIPDSRHRPRSFGPSSATTGCLRSLTPSHTNTSGPCRRRCDGGAHRTRKAIRTRQNCRTGARVTPLNRAVCADVR